MKISEIFEGGEPALIKVLSPNFVGKPSKKTLREVEIEYLLHILYKYHRKNRLTPDEANFWVEVSRNKLK